MKRAIITPAVLAADALSELKSWLAITTTRDDASLNDLLRAALETCEGFTGIMPLAAGCEEVCSASYDWQRLATSPVTSITGVEQIAMDGSRMAVPVDHYLIDINGSGCGRIRLLRAIEESRIAIAFTAGLSATWAELPDGLRHGVIRLAAHQYRIRDSDDDSGAPPASVGALWRPWRRMRLT